MVHIARGVASAALTLQSIRLQALLGKDVLTPAEVRPRTLCIVAAVAKRVIKA